LTAPLPSLPHALPISLPHLISSRTGTGATSGESASHGAGELALLLLIAQVLDEIAGVVSDVLQVGTQVLAVLLGSLAGLLAVLLRLLSQLLLLLLAVLEQLLGAVAELVERVGRVSHALLLQFIRFVI